MGHLRNITSAPAFNIPAKAETTGGSAASSIISKNVEGDVNNDISLPDDLSGLIGKLGS